MAAHDRFGVFGGENFYASGGLRDLIAAHSSLDDAMTEVKSLLAGHRPIEWWQVFDFDERMIVASSKYQAYGDGAELGESLFAGVTADL